MALTVRDPKYFFAVLSSMLLLAPKPMYVFDQFAEKEFDFAKTLGDTMVLNRYPYLGEAGLSQIARQLSETVVIGTADPVSITAEAVTLILQEFGGPYSIAGAKVSPLGITEKVARFAQNKLVDMMDVTGWFKSIAGALLKDDHDRLHDRILFQLCMTSPNTTNPGSKADGATLVTDKFGVDDLLTIKEKLDTRNAPEFDDGLYVAVLSPRMEKHLKSDVKFRDAVRYGSPERLYRGEIGTFEGFRCITSKNMVTETVNALTAHDGIFMGQQAYGYVEAMAAEIRKNKNDDYERFLYLVWLAYRAYSALNTSFIEIGRTFAA
ncbi:MAG: N4-gp56 family major capsid protein [Chroococcidiopsis sp.]